MPKGYWIAQVTITDPQPYQRYAEAAGHVFTKHGAVILARGGKAQQLEGEGRPRNVVIEFPSLEAAIACYHSAEYQAAKLHRQHAGEASVVLVEGV